MGEDGYCAGWVEGKDLSEDMAIAVPKLENNLISSIMMPESIKNNSVSFKFEHENKAADMNSFVFFEVSPEVLEMLNSRFIQFSDLINLLLNSPEESRILSLELLESILNSNGVNIHIESHHLLNLSKVVGLRLPDLSSLAVDSMDLTTSLATGSLTSLMSSSDISDISRTFFFNSSSLKSLNISANARLATADQLMISVLSISPFNLSGTDNVIVPILDLQSNYLYYVYAKDIFKSFGSDIIFEPITSIKLLEKQQVYDLEIENTRIS